MSTVVILLKQPECHVCGKPSSKKDLEEWNGVLTCQSCKHSLNEEYESYGKPPVRALHHRTII